MRYDSKRTVKKCVRGERQRNLYTITMRVHILCIFFLIYINLYIFPFSSALFSTITNFKTACINKSDTFYAHTITCKMFQRQFCDDKMTYTQTEARTFHSISCECAHAPRINSFAFKTIDNFISCFYRFFVTWSHTTQYIHKSRRRRRKQKTKCLIECLFVRFMCIICNLDCFVVVVRSYCDAFCRIRAFFVIFFFCMLF